MDPYILRIRISIPKLWFSQVKAHLVSVMDSFRSRYAFENIDIIEMPYKLILKRNELILTEVQLAESDGDFLVSSNVNYP